MAEKIITFSIEKAIKGIVKDFFVQRNPKEHVSSMLVFWGLGLIVATKVLRITKGRFSEVNS